MKKANWLVFAFLLNQTLPTLSQNTAPQPTIYRLSAREAAALALERRTEILNAKLDYKTQEAFNKEVTGLALPQVNANAGMSYTFNIPVSVIPDFISPSVYGVLEREDVRNGNGDPIKFDGVINTVPARFGVPWQASVGVSVQQLLFQPDVFIGLKARSTALERYKNQLAVTEDSVKYNVYQAYYGVLIAETGMRFAKESSSRLDKLFLDQQELFKSGFIEKLDLDKTKVNLNNINSTVTRLRNLVQLSYASLKFALGIAQTDSLMLTDTLTVEEIQDKAMYLENDFIYENRNEVKTLLSANELLELQVRRYKLNAYPTVAAYWNMQTNAQRQQFNFFDTKDRWFFSNVAGLTISVPIIDGWQRKNRLKQAQYALEQNQNTISQFKQIVDLQVVSARTNFANALESLYEQVENKALAERVFETTKIKYERGLGSSFELLQTETSLQEALNNYYQALYNAVIARIGYVRALGKL